MDNDRINNDKENFNQMFAFAELASNQHNDRRQLTFRIAIGYTTLLALALYQTTKADAQELFPLSFYIPYFVAGLIVVLTIGYCWALKVLHVASNNDVRRRDFYLRKAECIAYHMSKNDCSSFTPDSSERYIIVNLGASQNKCPITEHELFNEKQPDIFIPSIKEDSLKGTPMRRIDFHYFSLIAIPIFLTTLLVINWLVKGDDSEINVFTILKNWDFPNIFQLKVR